MTLEEKVIIYLELQELSVEEKKDTEYLEDLLEYFESDIEIQIDKEYYIELFQKKYLNIWNKPLPSQSKDTIFVIQTNQPKEYYVIRNSKIRNRFNHQTMGNIY